MFDSIAQDIRQQFNFGNAVSKLIIINTVVFVTIMVVFAFVALFGGPDFRSIQHQIIQYLAVDSSIIGTLKKPWTLITTMFTHERLFHFIFNMLVLYWFGRIFGDLMGDRRVIPLYLMGGLMGVALYWIGSFLLLDGSSSLIGASAGNMAIVLAAAMVAPDYEMHLLLIGRVRLKYIVLALIVLDLISVGAMDNVGGVFAHMGGLLMGALYVNQVRNGNDFADGVNKLLDGIGNIFKPKEKKSDLKVYHKSKVFDRKKTASKKVSHHAVSDDENDEKQQKLDQILEKISKKGITSLTAEEKEFLDNASKM